MDLDVKVTHDARRTRVEISGEVTLGRLTSLLQVLEVDSKSWPNDDVLLDLSQLQSRFDAAEQALVREIVQLRLRGKRIELRWPER
jgi:hypothetical protein